MPDPRRTLAAHIATAAGALLAALAATASVPDPGEPPAAPVAVIGEERIPITGLGPETASKLEKIETSYARRRNDLDIARRTRTQDTISADAASFVDNRVLELEAARLGTTSKALLAALAVAPVTEADVRRRYARYRTTEREPYAKAAPGLRETLAAERRAAAERAYLRTLRERYHARVVAEPARMAVEAVGPARGPAGAPVVLVLYSDLECPYCRRVMPVLDDILDRYPGRVRLVYRHMPLTGLHEHAYEAARAAVCADRQGRFWDFVGAVFAGTGAPTAERLRAVATAERLDLDQYDACLAGHDPDATVDADEASSEALGLTATPTLFVNGRPVRGAVPIGDLAEVVEDELDRSAARPDGSG